jgi:membrane protein implicated in regulation of membrane protease activity
MTMQVVTDIWGLSLTPTILLIAAILIVVDFFIPSDIPTHISYVLICLLVLINVQAHFLIKIIFSLLTWFSLVAFHYYVWRAIVQKFVNNIIAPDRYRSSIDGIVGSHGKIREIDGNKMVAVKGDLWPCREAHTLEDGDSIIVISQNDGELEIKKY